MHSLVEKAKGAGVPTTTGIVLRTDKSPGNAIAARAKEQGTDFIVIGSRGLGASGRLFLGSVSADVVAKSEVRVLVVK